MEIKEDFFTQTKESLQGYVEDRLLLLKLQATDKISKGAALTATLLIATILGIVFLVLLGITLGFLFSELVDSQAGGFAIITGIYLALIAFVLFVLKKKIESTVIHSVIKKIFNQTKTENNGQHNKQTGDLQHYRPTVTGTNN